MQGSPRVNGDGTIALTVSIGSTPLTTKANPVSIYTAKVGESSLVGPMPVADDPKRLGWLLFEATVVKI